MGTLEVVVRSVYGVKQIYPANDAARVIAQIAGTKTLTTQTLALAKKLGMVVQEVLEPQLAEVMP
ncbi:MAG: hypothetical protein HY855_25045 [Burkholderiales bacterium]|nr:hypothetical protein [Burkholderiales bacterium]